MSSDLITAAEVAALLRQATGKEWTTSSARAELSRWGIRRAGVSDDARPKALFRRADVEAAIARRPGRGRRTDLNPREETP